MVAKKRSNFVYIAVFLVSFLMFDRLLFYLVRTEENKSLKKKGLSSMFYRKRDFNRIFFSIPKGTYDTVIMGSSRTYRGIHPYYLYKYLRKKAFKSASAKAMPKFNYFFYKQYKKYAGIPQVVIYGIDYFMFKMKTDHSYIRRIEAKTKERQYADGVSLLWANKTEVDSFLIDILEKFSSEDESEIATGRRMQKTDLPKDATCIDPFIGYGKKKSIDRQRPPRFKTHKYGPYPGVEGVWFFKLLKELEKDDVTVALVVLPSHIGTYESNFQREAFLADIRRLAKEFRNVHIMDYNRPGRFRLDHDNYFLDGGYGLANSHLSEQGARVLNRMLARDLKRFYEK